MKITAVENSRQTRTVPDAAVCAFAAHTNADQAHHTSASTSIERANHPQVRSRDSSEETSVTANTNTRSHSSSTGVVRCSGSLVSPASPGAPGSPGPPGTGGAIAGSSATQQVLTTPALALVGLAQRCVQLAPRRAQRLSVLGDVAPGIAVFLQPLANGLDRPAVRDRGAVGQLAEL